MDDWHPLWVVVLLSLIPTISGVTVIFLGIYRLNPLVFVFVGTVAAVGIQSYFYAMYKYFKQKKLKKLTVLAVLLALFFITPYTVYAIITPNWSFTVSTDKSVYKLGENVTITATLTNYGYITHSFTTIETSAWIRFYVRTDYWDTAWRCLMQWNETDFSLASKQTIEKTVIWNQMVRKSALTEELIPLNETGDYYVYAEIVLFYSDTTLFKDWVEITIEP